MFSPDNSLQMSVRLILDMLEEGVSLNTEEGVEEEEEKVDEGEKEKEQVRDAQRCVPLFLLLPLPSPPLDDCHAHFIQICPLKKWLQTDR